jgi:hypothetical protein
MAYPMIYRTITTGQSEETKLRIDALLGNQAAHTRLVKIRHDTISAAGIEVG